MYHIPSIAIISPYPRHLSADPGMAGVTSAGLSPDRIERSSFTQEYSRGEESKQCVICITGQPQMGRQYSTTHTVYVADFQPGTVVRRLACLHVFHAGCVDAWLVDNR